MSRSETEPIQLQSSWSGAGAELLNTFVVALILFVIYLFLDWIQSDFLIAKAKEIALARDYGNPVDSAWQAIKALDYFDKPGYVIGTVISQVIMYVFYVIWACMLIFEPLDAYYKTKTRYTLDLNGKTLTTTTVSFVNNVEVTSTRFDRLLEVTTEQDTWHNLFMSGNITLKALVFEQAGTREVELEMEEIDQPGRLAGRLKPLLESDATMHVRVQS